MKLKELLEKEKLDFNSVTDDSRKVDNETLFVAVYDDFIEDAKQRNAKEIVTKYDCEGVDIRLALSKLSKKLYPYEPKEVIGVTGTNGKTSTVSYINQIWDKIGIKGASLGTIGLNFNGENIKTANTTLNSPELHKIINDITIQGCTHLALEVSSHAIDLHRTSSLRFDKVGFTNLSPDHLDYHKSMEDYLNTKLKLFNNDLPAVVNADIPEFEKIKAISRGRVLSYGKNGEDLKILSRIAKETGQEIEALIFGKKYQLNLNVIGDFQAMNLLLAIGLASINNRNVLENLEDIVPLLKAPDGRIDFVASLKNGASVYVDYAHTPDALEKLLKALKPHASNKLAVVFGCGGDRDKTKRPIMGKISNDLADVAYVTDDNPRTEDASEIRKEIMETATKATEIGNRKDAIEMAIANLEAGDILVIAGKGHETGQTIGKVVHDFNDKKIALEYITDKGL